MKKIANFLQLSFFLSFLVFFNSTSSYAACSFGNLQIGDDVSKVGQLYGMLEEGEIDGKIQVLAEDVCVGEKLDKIGIPYSCCGAMESAITFNKFKCNEYAKKLGFQCAESYFYRKEEEIISEKIIKGIEIIAAAEITKVVKTIVFICFR